MFLNIQKLLYFFMDSFEVLNFVLFCCLEILLCMAKMSDKLSIELKRLLYEQIDKIAY